MILIHSNPAIEAAPTPCNEEPESVEQVMTVKAKGSGVGQCGWLDGYRGDMWYWKGSLGSTASINLTTLDYMVACTTNLFFFSMPKPVLLVIPERSWISQ